MQAYKCINFIKLQQKYDHHEVRGIWIYGQPGVGKSSYIRKLDDLYIKSMNKWWDGYTG